MPRLKVVCCVVRRLFLCGWLFHRWVPYNGGGWYERACARCRIDWDGGNTGITYRSAHPTYWEFPEDPKTP